MLVPVTPTLTKEHPYFSFATYTKARFKERVGKISIDPGFGCFHKERAGGCTFCRLDAFRPPATRASSNVDEQWDEGVANARAYKKFYAYFQMGTNTPPSDKTLPALFARFLQKPRCVGLMIGTRVDALTDAILHDLAVRGKEREVWLELGLQSTKNDVLARVNRGHTYEEFVDTLLRVEAVGNIYTAAHIIFGLPGESREEMLAGIERVSHLPLSAVKFHHLQIVKGAPIANEYEHAPFPLFTEDTYARFIADAIPLLHPRMVVERVVGDSHAAYLIAPKWTKSKNAVLADVRRHLAAREMVQGTLYAETPPAIARNCEDRQERSLPRSM